MHSLKFGRRTKQNDKVILPLMADDAHLTDFIINDKVESVLIDGTPWEFTQSSDRELKAESATQAFAADTEKSFGHSKKATAVLGDAKVSFINEAKSDWIIEDTSGRKLAQFTGANHGVRNVTLEVEDDAELSTEQEVFLAWVARIILESKLISTTTILTISLVIMALIGVAWFVF